ncbi:hypothetical protein GCM10027266_01000 [Arenimonas alkanexedens]
MAEMDQSARSPDQNISVSEADVLIDKLNKEHASRLKRIIKENGWPGRSLVGDDGAQAAWLIVQHSDHDPVFQREVLELLQPLVSSGDVKASEYAYLWDRIHSPQRYGTQGECTNDGKWVVREIESPEDVNARRAAAGLFPEKLEDYIKMAISMCREDG